MTLVLSKKIIEQQESYNNQRADILSRIPYGLKAVYRNHIYNVIGYNEDKMFVLKDNSNGLSVKVLSLSEFKPILRRLGSMTNEEFNKYKFFASMIADSIEYVNKYSTSLKNNDISPFARLCNWFILNNFDYKGLIGNVAISEEDARQYK